MPHLPDISARKSDHIELCINGDVGFLQKTTLFEHIELVHDALPELALSDIDLSTEFAGKTLAAPLLIAAMTGGTAEAERINRDLAALAQKYGIGFAFGSQRPLLTRGIEAGYRVRDVAPDILVLGNIGVVQARETPTARLREMMDFSGADALCVHLNPAMEVVQPEGDEDFRGGLDTLQRLVEELGRPVIAKETGCGLSRSVGQRLKAIGITHVDTSGAGGTSWVAVEMHRAEQQQRHLGARFRDWGIPTAASVAQLDGLGLAICATGGIKDGLEAAKAIALGARCAGIARPFLKAHAQGPTALEEALKLVLAELRITHLLTGSRSPDELRQKMLGIGAPLQRWLPKEGSLRNRAF